MIRQGHELTADVVEKCDVVVIGSGCGGSTLACRLAEHGRDVVILEKGGYHTKADFDQREINMLAKIDGARGLDSSDDLSANFTYGNNVGGASVHYWADSYRTPDDRLALWEERYGMKGHDSVTLAPHFAQIEKDIHVQLADDSLANRINQLVHQGATKLGWEVHRVPQARRGCLRSGHCMQGCAYDAKQSMLVTYVPRAIKAGARLYTDTQAAALEFEGTRVSAVRANVLDQATGKPTGVSVTVQAKAIVVAAGGYGTPEFLLRQGLKKRLPALGEHFFCNPCPQAHGLFDEEIVQWRNIPAAWGVEEFRLAKEQNGKYVEGGYLLMANQLHPGVLSLSLPGSGASHAALMKQMKNIGGTIAWIDDAEEGRVYLDGDVRKIQVPLTGGNALRIRDAWKKQARLLLQIGAKQVMFGDAADTRITSVDEIEQAVASLDLSPGRNLFAAPHPGGTARMGADAKTSVVGFDHRVHGTDNLYVADPSVFPTAPSVDPSISIMGFSFVAADILHQRLS